MFFMKPTASKLRHQDLEEAERELGAHRKAAEYHAAMSTMYAERVSRLKEEIEAAAEVVRNG